MADPAVQPAAYIGAGAISLANPPPPPISPAGPFESHMYRTYEPLAHQSPLKEAARSRPSHALSKLQLQQHLLR